MQSYTHSFIRNSVFYILHEARLTVIQLVLKIMSIRAVSYDKLHLKGA